MGYRTRDSADVHVLGVGPARADRRWRTRIGTSSCPRGAAALEVVGPFEMPRVAMVLLVWTALSAMLAWGFFRWRRRGDG